MARGRAGPGGSVDASGAAASGGGRAGGGPGPAGGRADWRAGWRTRTPGVGGEARAAVVRRRGGEWEGSRRPPGPTLEGGGGRGRRRGAARLRTHGRPRLPARRPRALAAGGPAQLLCGQEAAGSNRRWHRSAHSPARYEPAPRRVAFSARPRRRGKATSHASQGSGFVLTLQREWVEGHVLSRLLERGAEGTDDRTPGVCLWVLRTACHVGWPAQVPFLRPRHVWFRLLSYGGKKRIPPP